MSMYACGEPSQLGRGSQWGAAAGVGRPAACLNHGVLAKRGDSHKITALEDIGCARMRGLSTEPRLLRL